MAEQRINLNAASVEELAALPNVGSDVAQCIVNAREENGHFCNTSGLIAIAGVTQEAKDSLARYTYVANTVVSQLPAAWTTTSHGLLLRKFRAVYEDNQELAERIDAHFKEVVKRHNPNFDDTVSAPDANTACALYEDVVMHAIRKLNSDPDIEYFDRWEIPAGSRREYDKPVLVCGRFAMGPDAVFVIGQSINPTLTIIAEEIEMDPDSEWSWTPRHPVIATEQRPRAVAGTPDYDPEVYESGQPAHVNGLAGGNGAHGVTGFGPDDYPGGQRDACEAPTVQIIALSLLSLSSFDLRGQDGARGGRGQDGGRGGDGSRGRDGEEVWGPGPFFIPIVACEQRPGQGGRGGRGGDAGDGGRGWDGADGGTLRLFTTPESYLNLLREQPELVLLIEGGDGGAGGEPGNPGEAGRHGLDGSVPEVCDLEKRIFDRIDGSPGVHGQGGDDGRAGSLEPVMISDLDFELIIDLPRLDRLEPVAAPPGAAVVLVGHNLENASGVLFSAYPHPLPIRRTSSGQYEFTVPDVPGGWAEVSLENGGHIAPDWTLEAVELDFMVTPRIHRIYGPEPEPVWLDQFRIDGTGFRPNSDRVRVEIAGDFYTGIIDPQQSSRHRLVFRLPQVDDLVDVPRGNWDTVVMGVYGYSSNTVPLPLHSCRSVPLRPMPLFEDRDTSDYPYRPFGFYFHNFSQGVPDWEMFLDTYGKANIAERVALDTLFNAVVMSSIGTLSPVGGRLGPLLTLPGTVGYFYAIWYYFLNGTIGEGMCTGMSAQALLDHLVGVDCFGRTWNGTDTTARRLITLGSSRMLSQEVLFGILFAQCAQGAASIAQAYATLYERMASAYTRDEAPILFFLPSGEFSDDPQRFMEVLRSTHAIVPYMIVEDIPTQVEIAGASQTRNVNRIYVYDSNKPFGPYDDAWLTGLGNEADNAVRPHPSIWDTLPACLTSTVTPCRQTPAPSNLAYVSVWDDSGAGDWRFYYDADTNSDAGFTLGVSPLGPFNGEQYLNLPVESWFTLLQQALELILSPATLRGVYRWDSQAENGLGEPWQATTSASPMGRPVSQRHEIHFVRKSGPSVRVLYGTEEGSSYSYRHFDPRLDVSIVDMPTATGEEDYLYLDPEEGVVELRTHRSTIKRVHLLLQRWTGEEADYLSLGNLPLSAKEPLRLSISGAWTSVQVESPANGRRVACTLVRLGADGAASQHKEDLVINNGGASLSFDAWKSVCDENLDLEPDTCIWTLRDRIDLSDSDSKATNMRHDYQSRQRPSKGKATMSSKEAPLTDVATATADVDRSVRSPLPLPADALYAESFRIGNLIPRKPLKIVRHISNRGHFQQVRVLVNGQPVTRSDWFMQVPLDQKAGSDVLEGVAKAYPKLPFTRRRYDTMHSEFVIPASYVTAPELEIRLETVDSDFPLAPLSYAFFQEPILRVVELFHEEAGLSATVELDNGLMLPLGELLHMAQYQRISINGLKAARRAGELLVQWNRSLPRRAGLRVEKLERDGSGRPQRVLLSDGSIYSAQEFIEQLQVGGLRVRNAYLAGKPDAPRIELVGEGSPKPFEHSVKTLFAEDNPQKQSFKPGPKTES